VMMQSVGSYDGLNTYSNTPLTPLGPWTMDNELSYCRYGHIGYQMGRNPTPWTMHPKATLGFDLRMLHLEMIGHLLER
jgi:hypothetical protein